MAGHLPPAALTTFLPLALLPHSLYLFCFLEGPSTFFHRAVASAKRLSRHPPPWGLQRPFLTVPG